jgi:hypothetical protein
MKPYHFSIITEVRLKHDGKRFPATMVQSEHPPPPGTPLACTASSNLINSLVGNIIFFNNALSCSLYLEHSLHEMLLEMSEHGPHTPHPCSFHKCSVRELLVWPTSSRPRNYTRAWLAGMHVPQCLRFTRIYETGTAIRLTNFYWNCLVLLHVDVNWKCFTNYVMSMTSVIMRCMTNIQLAPGDIGIIFLPSSQQRLWHPGPLRKIDKDTVFTF